MAQFDKRAIKNNAVDGSKLLLLNNQGLRGRNAADNTDVELFKVSASDEWVFVQTPKIGSSHVATEAGVATAVASEAAIRLDGDTVLQQNIDIEAATRDAADDVLQAAIDIINTTTIPGETTARQAADTLLDGKITTQKNRIDQELLDRAAADTALQASITDIVNVKIPAEQDARFNADVALQTNITNEANARIAADAYLQLQLDATNSALSWKTTLKVITADAELAAAIEGDTVASVLPFSDDQTPFMVEADLLAGDLLMTSGATPKIFKVYDDAGVKKLTLVGVEQPVAGHTWIVANDLLDSPGPQEGRAIYHFTGSAVIKLGDFDWSFATGIDISADYQKLAGNILVTDNVEQAIGKLEKKADDVIALEASHNTATNQRITNLTTAQVTEDPSKLYFTDARAQSAAVVDSLSGSETNKAPSVSAIKTYIAAQSDNTEVEAIVLNAGHISAGYVDLQQLAHKVLEVTPKGFPPQHPVDDYSLSTVGGVTRITFAGDMLSLISGDQLKVAYSY